MAPRQRTFFSMPMTLDNILKLAIAGLISLLTFIGNDMMKSIEKLELKIGAVETAIAELKTDIKYLSGKTPTAMKSTPAHDETLPPR